MNKSTIWNIPNLLSIIRLLLIPPFVILFFQGGDALYGACAILVLSGLSDMLDGVIARKFHQVTALGQVLDPIADKLTQGAVAVCMIIAYASYPAIVALFALFFLKEFLMGIGGLVLFLQKKRPTPAKWYGKAATAAFYLSVVVIIFLKAVLKQEPVWLTWALVVATAVLMLNAFVRYLIVFFQIKNGVYDYGRDNPANSVPAEGASPNR